MRHALPLLAAFALVAPTFAAEPARRPNVLFVIADDLNCDLGCYGHPVVKSPNIDRLAAKGVRFDRAYVQYTVCNPSRASFLTGLRPTTTKVLDNATPFRKTVPDAVTLPQLFRANGYTAGGLGKVFHRGLSPDDPKAEMDDKPSWDHTFYGKATPAGNAGDGRDMSGGKLAWCRWKAAGGTDADQPDGQTTAEAIRLMEAAKGKPFFLAVGFYRPHDPFQSPKAYFDLYPPDRLPLPPAPPTGYAVPTKFSLPGGPLKAAFDAFGEVEKREFLRAYYAGASFADAQLGRLLDALDRLKLADDTVVVFLGDHGYELGTRNWWNKATLFERSCRTPLVVYAPGMKGNGKPTAAVTEFVDLYPTLADLCGLKDAPKALEGVSLRPILDDPAKPGKAGAVTVVKRGPVLGRSVRTARWRYTEWDGGKQGAELYDHTADPGEWANLATDRAHATTVRELKVLLGE